MSEPDGGSSLLRGTLIAFCMLAIVASIVSQRWQEQHRFPNANCKSNLKNMGTALDMYARDNLGRFPDDLRRLTPGYLRAIPTCPHAGRDTYTQRYRASASKASFTLVCEGENHRDVGYSANFPQYTSTDGLLLER